jgi:hypothetical protein
MLWDGSFDSWRELGAFSQPAGFLLTADGTLEAQWQGAIPEAAVLERIASLR